MKKTIFIPMLVITLLMGGCASPGYFEPTPITHDGNGMLYIYRPAASNPGPKYFINLYPVKENEAVYEIRETSQRD